MAGVATNILLLTLTLLALTLTLTHACRFSRGYVCQPNQPGRCRGQCSVQRGGCVCIPSMNYGYYPRQRFYRRRFTPREMYNARRYWDRHPFYEAGESPYSESRMEQSMNMMVELRRMSKLMT